jgi:two-component system, sensor histidine kinase FlrB
MSQTAASKQQLQDAFELFNQVSEQLTGSYAALQQQVTGLNRELATARTERLQLLTEIRTLQQEASRRRRLSSMGEMTARLAHQVRTPLSTALLYASQLKQPGLPAAQHDCFVDRLLVGLRHLDHMVNDMLVFARGGQGGDELVDPGALLEQVRQSLQPRLEARRASWQVIAANRTARVQGQRELLASVLGNLASNALDACGEGAQLFWQVAEQGSDLMIVLQDNGPGIAADLCDRIFEPFFTTRASGTGLGLAVVRAVIDAHQGDIELDADCRDGARFVIRLPRYQAQQQLPSERLKSQQKAAIASSRYVE